MGSDHQQSEPNIYVVNSSSMSMDQPLSSVTTTTSVLPDVTGKKMLLCKRKILNMFWISKVYFTSLKFLRPAAFCYQKLFWPFTLWINCSSDLKNFANSRPSASNFKSFSRSLEQFFLTVGQNNFGNKIPLFMLCVLLNWLKLVYGPCTILIPCPI